MALMSIPDSVAIGVLIGFVAVVLVVAWGEITDRWKREDRS